jgi:hypothetical protein
VVAEKRAFVNNVHDQKEHFLMIFPTEKYHMKNVGMCSQLEAEIVLYLYFITFFNLIIFAALERSLANK